MRKIILFVVFLLVKVIPVQADVLPYSTVAKNQEPIDSLRLAGTDRVWDELSRTVREGDLEAYAATYHPDAVVVFGSKNSKSISEALKGWEQLFVDTKSGKIKADVEFRFSRRIGDEATAHETGVFRYTTSDEAGNMQEFYSHFEGLLVKKGDQWLILMENQKSAATPEEWENLK